MGLNEQLRRLERASAPQQAYLWNGFATRDEMLQDVRDAMEAGSELYVWHSSPSDVGKAYVPYLLLADELDRDAFRRQSERYAALHPRPSFDVASDPRKPYRPGPWAA